MIEPIGAGLILHLWVRPNHGFSNHFHAFGMFSLVIGTGTQISSTSFSDVNWGAGLSQLLSFNENLIFNNYIQEQNEGQFVVYNNTSVEKVEELYKQLLKEKDELIAILKGHK